jgi:uncharacterized membrane protein YtjA (UPF0391 family)
VHGELLLPVTSTKLGAIQVLPYSKSHFEVQRRPDRQGGIDWLCLFSDAGHLTKPRGGSMLYWALVFLIVAIIAAIFGFGGVAVAAAGIAKLLFFIFLVVFVITLITGLTRRGSTGV